MQLQQVVLWQPVCCCFPDAIACSSQLQSNRQQDDVLVVRQQQQHEQPAACWLKCVADAVAAVASSCSQGSNVCCRTWA